MTVREQITRDIHTINDSIGMINTKISKDNHMNLIVSDLDSITINTLYKLIVGKECPISSLKQLSNDILKEDLVSKLHNIVMMNSHSFFADWSNALDNLEKLQLK
jgi:hypothetical protein